VASGDLGQIVLRPLIAEDIRAAAELSFEQHWPHRDEDWALFLELGEGLVAELDGKIAGTIMAWRFGDNMATLGMVIVTNAAQGRGLGRKLMEAMLERLEDRTVVLNATVEGFPLYKKLGFIETGEVFQHQGSAPVVPLVELLPGERIRPINATDGACLAELYSRATGMDRAQITSALLEQSSAVVLTRDHVQVGFALFRRFGRGWSIAPVIAPDESGAKALISHWLAANTGTFCRIDITGASGLGPWLADLGLPQVGQVVTMALGPAPNVDSGLIALAAQALG
jgi:predicted N-acetyltransferase YhbS